MISRLSAAFSISLLLYLFTTSVCALSMPISGITRIATLRENQLVGYGIVVGLPGTGDTRSPLAVESIRKLLEHRGIELSGLDWKSKNMAAVMVMGSVSAFARPGDKIDIWVSSIGDARSLRGGFLLQTPLSDPSSNVFAVAQGALAVADTDRVERSVNTVRIPGGAIMEKEVLQPLFVEDNGKVYARLRLIDFSVTMASRITEAVNKEYKDRAMLDKDGTIRVELSGDSRPPLTMLREMLELSVEVEAVNRVVVDPRSGSVVMGGNVGISRVSVSRGKMQVRIGYRRKADPVLQIVEESTTVSSLVDALNKLGVEAPDILEILKAIHAAGAMHGELVIL